MSTAGPHAWVTHGGFLHPRRRPALLLAQSGTVRAAAHWTAEALAVRFGAVEVLGPGR